MYAHLSVVQLEVDDCIISSFEFFKEGFWHMFANDFHRFHASLVFYRAAWVQFGGNIANEI